MDSFDHRFGDDLFELIISYLPIEDKYRFEAISRRFQRLLFRKQRVLKISFNNRFYNWFSINSTKLLSDKQTISLSKLRSLLKKFPNIQKIEFNLKDNKNKCQTIDKTSEVLDTIANICHHLTAISFDFSSVTDNVMTKFCQKFGHQLKDIRCLNFKDDMIKDIYWKYLLKMSPNLLSVSNVDINCINRIEVQNKKLFKIIDLNVDYSSGQTLDLIPIQTSLDLRKLSINLMRKMFGKQNVAERLFI